MKVQIKKNNFRESSNTLILKEAGKLPKLELKPGLLNFMSLENGALLQTEKKEPLFFEMKLGSNVDVRGTLDGIEKDGFSIKLRSMFWVQPGDRINVHIASPAANRIVRIRAVLAESRMAPSDKINVYRFQFEKDMDAETRALLNSFIPQKDFECFPASRMNIIPEALPEGSRRISGKWRNFFKFDNVRKMRWPDLILKCFRQIAVPVSGN